MHAPHSNEGRSDKDTKLDVLAIMANLAADTSSRRAREEIRVCLMGISEWFDSYMEQEECDRNETEGGGKEPELHKAMLLLLARAWDYRSGVHIVHDVSARVPKKTYTLKITLYLQKYCSTSFQLFTRSDYGTVNCTAMDLVSCVLTG